MDKIFNVTSVFFGIAGGFIASLLGAWDKILWALLVLMALDYITGIIKAIYIKQLSSEIGFKGLLRKLVILAVVALANIMQEITGDNVAIREIIIMFYISNEGISILENVAAVSPKLPDRLREILLQLRGDNDE